MGLSIKERSYEEFTLDELRPPRWVRFLLKNIIHFAVYRFPLPVTEYVLYHETFGQESVYYLCPRCAVTMERDYQAFCDRCGQKLDWHFIEFAVNKEKG